MAAVAVTETDLGTTEVRTVRLSWGSILGGACVALGVFVLLVAAGMGVGLTAINPQVPASARLAGIATGIWTLIVPIISLFLGGLVASRVARPMTRSSGMIHGAVLWGLATLVGCLAFMVAVGGVGTLAARTTGTVAGMLGQTGIEAMRGAPGIAGSLGLDFDDALAPINRRLTAQGKPEIKAREMEAATRDVVGRAVRDGRFDRESVVAALADNTRLTRAESRQVAARLEASFNERKQQLSGVARDAGTVALKAADATGKAMAWASLGLFLGLVAAVGGASIGVPGRPRTVTRERPPLATSRQVPV